MTLKDIAQEVGVSISTVSRVINQKGTNAASKELQDRIWEVVRRTGYVPNSSAQNLKRTNQPVSDSTPHIIACLFARSPESINDPFFAGLAHEVEQSAYQKNCIVKFFFTVSDFKHLSVQQIILDNHVEGLVILGRCDKDLLASIKRSCKHIVCVGLNAFDAKVDQIICDGHKIGQMVADYLISLGHRHIGYIGEVNNEARFSGYRTSLLEKGIAYSPRNVVNVILSSENGYKGAKQLLTQAPNLTAIFCANDATAVGAIRALQEDKINVPSNISIVSVDNIEIAQYTSPTLTTVHIPLNEMGHMAVNFLADRIDGGHHGYMQVHVPFSLIERESSSKPPVSPQL